MHRISTRAVDDWSTRWAGRATGPICGSTPRISSVDQRDDRRDTNRAAVAGEWCAGASGGAPDSYTLNVTGAFTGSVGTAELSLPGTSGQEPTRSRWCRTTRAA